MGTTGQYLNLKWKSQKTYLKHFILHFSTDYNIVYLISKAYKMWTQKYISCYYCYHGKCLATKHKTKASLKTKNSDYQASIATFATQKSNVKSKTS